MQQALEQVDITAKHTAKPGQPRCSGFARPHRHSTFSQRALYTFSCLFRRGLTGLIFLATAASARASGECVVLIHGWGQWSNSMAEMEEKLSQAGLAAFTINYPSLRAPIEDLAEEAVPRGVDSCREIGALRIHFVGHSMGGLMIRLYLRDHRLPELGRVVMLGTPNQGTQLVDRFDGLPGFGLLGPARQLGTGPEAIVRQLPPVDFDLGVIAGKRSINPLSPVLIDGTDDGLVSVESTRVEGMRQHIILPAIHNTMPRNNRVIDHTIHYLKLGNFIPE